MSKPDPRDIRSALKAGLVAPFEVRSIHDGHIATVEGFTEHDPLGVGAVFGGFATAYYKGGGWGLVEDLCKHFRLVIRRTPIDPEPDSKEM